MNTIKPNMAATTRYAKVMVVRNATKKATKIKAKNQVMTAVGTFPIAKFGNMFSSNPSTMAKSKAKKVAMLHAAGLSGCWMIANADTAVNNARKKITAFTKKP